MTTIFIEDKKDGKDAEFLKILLKKLFSNDPECIIESGKGYTNLSKLENQLRQNDDGRNKNIIIFDADSVNNGGGYQARKRYLENELEDLDVNYELFLLPNNQDDGSFETLYENIINQKHKTIIKCFENYEACLGKITDDDGNPSYNIPSKKSKMYAYITAHKMSNKHSESQKNKNNWQFENTEYWDLNNEYLNPLRDFLKQNLYL